MSPPGGDAEMGYEQPTPYDIWVAYNGVLGLPRILNAGKRGYTLQAGKRSYTLQAEARS